MAQARPRWSASRVLHALACAASICVTLVLYGVLQERIMTVPYGTDPPAFFHWSLFLVLANRLAAVLLVILAIALRGERRDLVPAAPLRSYAAVSLSNAIATSCQYEALKWLTFPTLTVGKCTKMLPVMLLLHARDGRRYSRADVAAASGVVCGAALMVLSGGGGSGGAGVARDAPVGYALLAGYLLFDAATSTHQDHLFGAYRMSVRNQMLFINAVTGALSLCVLVGGGALRPAAAFLRAHPAAARDVAALSLAAAAGQFAISHTISAFGALMYAGIMTARQFASVLASNALFGHALRPLEWAGALTVFCALFLRTLARARADASPDKPAR